MSIAIRKTMALLLMSTAVFYIPDLLPFKKKMEFAEDATDYTLTECNMSGNRCLANNYRLELLEGKFDIVSRTTFVLYHNNKPVLSDVLVTSDDHQFGTIYSQHQTAIPGRREVLIPYCGNPIMRVVIIDDVANHALIVNGLATKPLS